MKRMCLFTLVAGALVGGLALFSAAGSRGEKPRGKGAPDSTYTDHSPTNGVSDAQEVEAFFDELIPKHPLGCYRPRIPDRVVFEKLVQVWTPLHRLTPLQRR